MNLLLERYAHTPECTQGRLTLPNGVQLMTLELPWVPDPDYPGGEKDKSCVPPAVYELVLHDTLLHPRSFALVNLECGVCHEPDPAFPNARIACLIHVANIPSELEGCIGLGMTASPCVVASSRMALDMFNRQVPWVTGHTLDIRAPAA